MAFNVKDPATHATVKKIAARTGLTQETIIRRAVDDYLRAVESETHEKEQRILSEGAHIGRILGLSPGDDPTQDLYDENGLPA